jgi:PAS domain S-box-containing protein
VEAVGLVGAIRGAKKPIGIVAMVGAAEKQPPKDLFKAGVDSFVLKRPGYAAFLGEALQQARERHPAESAHRRQVRLLYAGDMENAKRQLSSLPYVIVEPLPLSPDGLLHLPDAGALPKDLILVDSSHTGAQTLKAIKEAKRQAPDIPIIVLTDPGDEDGAIQAMQSGAADCIAKTKNYSPRLVAAVERELGRQELAREKVSLKSRQERLRLIVETMPVGVTVIALDGTFLAINRAGLKLMGVSQLEQVIGKNLIHLLPQEERDQTLAFLTSVCGGASRSTRITWKGLDGTITGIELRAVPMRREGIGTAVALAAMYPPSGQSGQGIDEKIQKKFEDLEKSLTDSEARVRDLQDKHNLQQSKLEAELEQAESRRLAAEEQQGKLKSAAEEAAARLKQAQEEQLAERANWEQSRQSLKEQCARIEDVAESLRSAQASLIETHNAEQAQWSLLRQELEQNQQAAEKKLGQLSETLRSERSQWELARQEWEKKYQAAEKQRSTLQAALHEVESRVARLTEEHGTQRSQRVLAQRELEQKYQATEEQRAALQEALKKAEFRITQMAEEQNAERSQRDLAQRESEQKLQAAEQQRADLQAALGEAQSRLAQLTEKHGADLSQLDLAQRESEQKLQAAEQQRAVLQAALSEAESRLAQLTEKHGADFSQLDLARQELDQKYQAAEQQRAALQAALGEAESRLAQLIEKHSTELSQRDFAQKKAEQKFQAAEKQRIALQNASHDAESSLAQLTEKHSAERAQWDLARTELENAVREAESRLARISEQNQAKAMQLEKMQQEMEQLKADSGRFVTESTDFRLRYQRLSQYASAGVVLAERDGRVLECNDAAARMFGYAGAAEALSQSGQIPFRLYAFEGALDARLQQEGKLENIEWASLGCDGRLVRIQENATLVEDPVRGHPVVERILIDNSKIYTLSEEIRHVRRMETAGDLAAATVKSLKELCTSLAHSGELLMETPNDSSAVRRVAEALLNDANRGAKHARQFLSVAQKSDRTPALLNVNDILANNNVLLHSLTGGDIDLQTVLSPRIGLVSADRNEMVQLIGNLLSNSREALPLGGTVTIETLNIEIDSTASSGHPANLKPGIYVRMAFSADGCVVQPDRRTASIRMIVERMGGNMETTNDPKLGNINRVYLPRVEAYPGQAELSSNVAGA